MTKKAFAFSVLALLCAGSVQALDTSVKPVVTFVPPRPTRFYLRDKSEHWGGKSLVSAAYRW